MPPHVEAADDGRLDGADGIPDLGRGDIAHVVGEGEHGLARPGAAVLRVHDVVEKEILDEAVPDIGRVARLEAEVLGTHRTGAVREVAPLREIVLFAKGVGLRELVDPRVQLAGRISRVAVAIDRSWVVAIIALRARVLSHSPWEYGQDCCDAQANFRGHVLKLSDDKKNSPRHREIWQLLPV